MPTPKLKSIVKHEKYFFDTNKKVFAITDDGFEEIIFETEIENEIVNIADFFVVDDAIYMKRDVDEEEEDGGGEKKTKKVRHCYMQEDNSIIELDEEDFPEKPEIIQEYLSKNWSITRVPFEGSFVSHVKNLYFKGMAAFVDISGFHEVETGLYFNVIESGKPGLTPGLYFFPINRKSPNKVKEIGKVW